MAYRGEILVWREVSRDRGEHGGRRGYPIRFSDSPLTTTLCRAKVGHDAGAGRSDRRCLLRGFPPEGELGCREPLAPPAACDSLSRDSSATAPAHRPCVLGDRVPAVVTMGGHACDRATGDGHRVAPAWLRAVVGMEVAAHGSAARENPLWSRRRMAELREVSHRSEG
jgi:hypothetical protein